MGIGSGLWLRALWEDRKRRNLAILTVLVALLAVVVAVRLLSGSAVPDGAMRRVVCLECGAQMDMPVGDIDDPKYICPECRQGKLAYLWKCEECRFEYPMKPRPPPARIPTKTMAKFRAAMDMQRCPNCDSPSTAPVAAAD